MKLLPGQVGDAQWGPLDCPFCAKRIADSVAQLGQQITCPHCHSTFTVKDTRKTDFAKVGLQAISLLFIILFLIFLLAPVVSLLFQ